MEVDEANDKVQLMTFKAELKSKEFVISLAKIPPRQWQRCFYRHRNTSSKGKRKP